MPVPSLKEWDPGLGAHVSPWVALGGQCRDTMALRRMALCHHHLYPGLMESRSLAKSRM